MRTVLTELPIGLGVRQVDEHIWLVTFMHYHLGYFDDETCRLDDREPVWSSPVTYISGIIRDPSNRKGPKRFGGAARI